MMVTAYGDHERRRQAAEYGAAEFLTKPVELDLQKVQLRNCLALPTDRSQPIASGRFLHRAIH